MTNSTRNGSTREWRSIRQRILERDAHICAYCGGEANTVDHILPIAHGGTDHDSNLIAACGSCNSSKRDRLFWAPRTPLPPSNGSLSLTHPINPPTPFARP